MTTLAVYNSASNAKINLQKTEAFSLAGNPQSDWSSFLTPLHCRWHDRNSTNPLTYLGYPVYHDQLQLDLFLEKIYEKIERHARILSARNLSIMGKGLTANTLLLSRLWHILRVTVVPRTWLKRGERLVRNYICLYGYKPSWEAIHSPKFRGGAAVVNVREQSLALHQVYISHLLSHDKVTFVSSLMSSLFRAYTGHASILIWLLSPRQTIPMLRKSPQISQLTELILSLPPLLIRHDWPTHLLTLLPLSTVLWHPLAPNPRIKAKMVLPVADAVHWYLDRGILLRRPRSEISNKQIVPYVKEWAHSNVFSVPLYSIS